MLIKAMALFFLAGCSSVRVQVLQPLLTEPQVPGKTTFVGGLGGRRAQDVVAIQSAQTRPPDMSQGVGAATSMPYFDLGVGLGSHFLLSADLGFLPSYSGVKLKWQLFGPTLVESQKSGAFVMAVNGGLLSSSVTATGDQQTTFGPGGYRWNAKSTALTTEGGFSMGYIVNEFTLLFVGYSYADLGLKSTVSQAPSTTGDSAGGEYTSETRGWVQSPGIGVRFGRSVRISLVGQYLTGQYFGVGNRSESAFFVNLGFGGADSR